MDETTTNTTYYVEKLGKTTKAWLRIANREFTTLTTARTEAEYFSAKNNCKCRVVEVKTMTTVVS